MVVSQKGWVNLKSKLTFSVISFNFCKTRLFFARYTHVGTREVTPSPKTYDATGTNSPRSKS